MIKAYAAHEPHGKLEPFEYDPGELADDQVEIDVVACGVCHSDLSLLNNEWHISSYPLVPGHEVVGRVAQRGSICICKSARETGTIRLTEFSLVKLERSNHESPVPDDMCSVCGNVGLC